jgi:16S rRNA (uracil1498-N3)-methyltransferase
LQRLVISSAQLQNQQIILTGEQQHYLKRVLRLQLGDRFIAMDGQGSSWLAELCETGTTATQAAILEPISVTTELPIGVTLVAALPKGNGFDEVVRQTTEAGVTSIIPVISDRTLLHPSPQKLERWRRIAQETAEQAERQIVPTIVEPVPLTKLLQEHALDDSSSPTRRYLCVTRCNAPHLLTCLMQHSPSDVAAIAIAIGPEGGWTDTEVEAAIQAGYQPVFLGARILRAVTAPIVALSLVAAVWEQRC